MMNSISSSICVFFAVVCLQEPSFQARQVEADCVDNNLVWFGCMN